MSKTERRATFGLSLIYAFRMLGLFMVLPVFSVYAQGLALTTPFLIGLTVGIYGITQVCLQIPFGWASDKLGRRPIIILGLCLFAVGSIIAGVSHTIYGVMLGRAIQGAGAISSATMALLSDVTHEEHRTKAMAAIGMTIGLSFAVSVVLGPFLNQFIGVSGIFFVTAFLALFGILLLQTLVPRQKVWKIHHDSEASLQHWSVIFFNKTLAQLNLGILIQHAILTSTFVALPLLLENMAISMKEEWMVALPLIVLAFGFSIPLIVIAEVKRKIKAVFIISIFLLAVSELSSWIFHAYSIGLVLSLWLFFTAFCALEALLPSMVSKVAPAGYRGTAMGFYATHQFLGIFLGGVLAGWVCQHYSVSSVLLVNVVLLLLWWIVALFMQSPRCLSTCILRVSPPYPNREHYLAIAGVVDVAVCPDEGVVYLKIDKDICDLHALQSQLKVL